MSYDAREYPSGTSVIHAIRRGMDPELPAIRDCPVCGGHPADFIFGFCAYPDCGKRMCHECLKPCEVKHHGMRMYCPAHLSAISIGTSEETVNACPRCEEELEEEDHIEQARRLR